jgi:hypothetical protein
MTCEEFSDRLSAFHDGEIVGWRRWKVAVHLRSCPDCARELRELEEVDLRLLSSVQQQPAPEYLTAAVMRRLPAMPPARYRTNMVRWAVGVGVAAVQVIGMYSAYWWGFARGNHTTGLPEASPSMAIRGSGGLYQNPMTPLSPSPARLVNSRPGMRNESDQDALPATYPVGGISNIGVARVFGDAPVGSPAEAPRSRSVQPNFRLVPQP